MLRDPMQRDANCDCFSRRGFLRAGAMAFGGLSLADVLRLRAESPATGSSGQKSLIMIYLHGGPSHLDMYDLKPQAPVEFRGEFSPIQTNVPGMEICEWMPLQSQIADEFTILRGVRPNGPFHNGNEFYSGYPYHPEVRGIPGVVPRPAFGSVVSRLRQRNPTIPPYVSINNASDWEQPFYAGAENEPFRVTAQNSGEALENMGRHRDVSLVRFESRSGLISSLDRVRRGFESAARTGGIDRFQSQALEIVGSGKAREAFEIEKEPPELLARYGDGQLKYGIHPGKLLLRARRLVEAGVSVVTCGLHNWDTHAANFIVLRELLPALDRALYALITDLDERGLLKDVAIVMGGEFGRTPRVGDVAPDGRGHWSDASFFWVAGGGMQTGQVIGDTNANGERSTGKPIAVQQILATMYRALGIDLHATIIDHNGRPNYLLDQREPVAGLL